MLPATLTVLEACSQSQPSLQLHSSIFMSTLQLKALGQRNMSTQPAFSKLAQELAAAVMG